MIGLFWRNPEPGLVPVLLDVEKTEPVFKAGPHYLEKDQELKPGARARNQANLETYGETVMTGPHILVVMNDDGRAHLRFIDGLHRYCMARDGGAREILVFMGKMSKEMAERAGIAVKEREGT